jgi:hypothetical protein
MARKYVPIICAAQQRKREQTGDYADLVAYLEEVPDDLLITRLPRRYSTTFLNCIREAVQ